MDYVALKSELVNDPVALGYAPYLADGNNTDIARLMNAIGSYQIARKIIPSYEVINATTPSEWAALTSAEKQRYQTITGAAQIDVSNANVVSAFAAMFAAGTSTRTALVALTTRPGSRAEFLGFGPVTILDIANARLA